MGKHLAGRSRLPLPSGGQQQTLATQTLIYPRNILTVTRLEKCPGYIFFKAKTPCFFFKKILIISIWERGRRNLITHLKSISSNRAAAY